MTDSDRPSPRRGWINASILTIIAASTFTILLVVAGIVAVALASTVEDAAAWDRWANVGDAFGVLNGVLSGLAFGALIVTLWIQFRELSLQRIELKLQRDAIEKSSEELRRTAGANLRMLHIELMKMSIADPALAKVWPDLTFGEDDVARRQMVYANLIFQNLSLSMLSSDYTDDQIREALRYIFASEIMRDYWALSAPSRVLTEPPGTAAWRIGQLGDEVHAEFRPRAGGG